MGIAGGPRFLLLAFAARRALVEEGAMNVPKGPESLMIADSERPAANDLNALLALVAGSTIVPAPVRRPEVPFAGWEKACKSADTDAMILAWIAGFSRGSTQRGRLH
jgi:hypothetical protein